MKKFIIIIAGLAIAAISAKAQVGFAIQSISVPGVIPAGTTNLATTFTLDVRKQGRVTLGLTSTALATPGCTNQLIFQPSVDGVNYDTNSADLLTCSNSVVGLGPVTTTTTITVPGSVGYLKCTQMITTGTSSNNAASYGIKIATPY